MKNKLKNLYISLLIIIIYNLDLSKQEVIFNSLFILLYYFIQPETNLFKGHLRKIWEEDVPFDKKNLKEGEKDDIKHCEDSSYKYFIFFVSGQTYNFPELTDVNPYDAVSRLYQLINQIQVPLQNIINGNGTFSGYIQKRMGVGLYFIFIACAGISIIVWVFNWICWLNQCCCCDFLHNPVNKRIGWWMSFIFLLGILACCIAGCVSVNRFGFALEGARCAVDRIYYDLINGQLKIDEPKWKGLTNHNEKFNELDKFISENKNKGYKYPWFTDGIIKEEECKQNCMEKYKNIGETLENITKFPLKNSMNDWFKEKITDIEKLKAKDNFIKLFYHYEGILKGCMKILAMIYFCLLLIAVTLAGVSLMFYACLKRQGYLLTLMHILWNIIRFFMVSFFIFGTAYGISDLALTDSIAVIQYLFSSKYIEEYIKEGHEKEPIVPFSQFLIKCLEEKDYNYLDDINFLNEKNGKELSLGQLIINFYHYDKQLIKPKNEDPNIKNYFSCIGKVTLCDTLLWIDRDIILNRKGNFYESFNCGFIHNDLNILYKALYDASTESEYLAAVSLCASFFGAVAVYFYLLVLHHYNNEMFFDSGKSIFKGFDGYGGGFKKKNIQQDPAYKKRKLRAEIELTSKNDEANGYNKDSNKNDDEE